MKSPVQFPRLFASYAGALGAATGVDATSPVTGFAAHEAARLKSLSPAQLKREGVEPCEIDKLAFIRARS